MKEFDLLVELALDMRWSWNHSADSLWQRLDPKLFALTQNPWLILQNLSQETLRNALADSTFTEKLNSLIEAKEQRRQEVHWFQESYPKSPLKAVAYFSMEFMLSEALPIYSGGLGNVAGDQLKAASDLGVPVIGIGLLYQRGYFRQMINQEGSQEALFPYNDPAQLPITPLKDEKGERLRIEIKLPGYSVWLRAYEVQVGRNKLYLLDTNDAVNPPIHRGITSELYGGGRDLRLKQELVLGIGGWRLLSALNIEPEVCHLNEGHAAFAVLERARSFMEKTGQPFAVALAATRAGNLFTTHTAVAAGFDRFSPKLMEQYLTYYAEEKLGISLHDLLALGRVNPDDSEEDFNMAYLAVRGSGAVNGVSKLHEQVSKHVFSPLFPRWPESEVPISYVTNGIHTPSWDSEAADALWTKTCGKGRWIGTTENLEKEIRSIPDEDLWTFRGETRKALITYARNRMATQMSILGCAANEVEKCFHLLDFNTLTLGFARRFAGYKRPNLLLYDKERLYRLLINPERPVQLLIAGKAHPADLNGQGLIKQWTKFIRDYRLENHVMFLSDYDMAVTGQLVQGVDVWINTPRRPWEACGTSGMKVLVNGGLNLSELDGFWAEAYSPEVGWALGDGLEHGEDPALDGIEANQLYTLLENEVVPGFYNRDANGIPSAWVAKMRESMARLTPEFSANRAVREYTERFYLPRAEAYLKRSHKKGELGWQIVHSEQAILEKWGSVKLSAVNVQATPIDYFFEAEVDLSGLDPNNVRVQIYAESPPTLCEMKATSPGIYKASVPAGIPQSSYTLRVIPQYDGIAVPLEASQILWQK